MTPKDKAKELMQKSYDLDLHNKTPQWKCKGIALLVVEEMIQSFNSYESLYISEIEIPFWQEVKQEIERI